MLSGKTFKGIKTSNGAKTEHRRQSLFGGEEEEENPGASEAGRTTFEKTGQVVVAYV